MTISLFSLRDVPEMIELGRLMHDEAPEYAASDYSPAKLLGFAVTAAANPMDYCMFIDRKDSALVGMMIGAATEHFFGTTRYAADLLLYVRPDFRGGMTAPRLIKAFEAWAKGVGAKHISVGASTGVNPNLTQGLYSRLGYRTVGAILKKEL
jgi:GNAT superfamily N-acetyltransferase